MNSGICIRGKPEINGCILCNRRRPYQVVSTFNPSDYIENKNALVFRSFEEETVHIWIPSNLDTSQNYLLSVLLHMYYVMISSKPSLHTCSQWVSDPTDKWNKQVEVTSLPGVSNSGVVYKINYSDTLLSTNNTKISSC